jgi:hypothetical protein
MLRVKQPGNQTTFSSKTPLLILRNFLASATQIGFLVSLRCWHNIFLRKVYHKRIRFFPKLIRSILMPDILLNSCGIRLRVYSQTPEFRTFRRYFILQLHGISIGIYWLLPLKHYTPADSRFDSSTGSDPGPLRSVPKRFCVFPYAFLETPWNFTPVRLRLVIAIFNVRLV